MFQWCANPVLLERVDINSLLLLFFNVRGCQDPSVDRESASHLTSSVIRSAGDVIFRRPVTPSRISPGPRSGCEARSASDL